MCPHASPKVTIVVALFEFKFKFKPPQDQLQADLYQVLDPNHMLESSTSEKASWLLGPSLDGGAHVGESKQFLLSKISEAPECGYASGPDPSVEGSGWERYGEGSFERRSAEGAEGYSPYLAEGSSSDPSNDSTVVANLKRQMDEMAGRKCGCGVI